MIIKKTAKGAKAVRFINKPRGKPFRSGDDPRRLIDGHKNKEAKDLAKAMKKALTEEGFRDNKFLELTKSVWARAIAGQPWAVEMIWDRIAGKVMQSMEHTGQVTTDGKFIIEVVHVKDGPTAPGVDNEKAKGK